MTLSAPWPQKLNSRPHAPFSPPIFQRTVGSSSGINAECPTDSFRCNNGKCISHHWVCNYQKDCDDGEDEMQSCPPPECETPQLNCGQYTFNKTYCIPPHYRCDMIEDCEDKSDEAQCSARILILRMSP
ncbi:GM11365 [Drosophila sechellia]|uniref:GM11365 n=1 Tax=Drosophila sechellia TaxID=7238 RepID=B4IDG2_DROSE|nr:GM11365 [Drosophila sechellia]